MGNIKFKLDAEMQGRFLVVCADVQTMHNFKADTILQNEDAEALRNMLFEQYLLGRCEADILAGEVDQAQLDMLEGWERELEDSRLKTMTFHAIPVGGTKYFMPQELEEIETAIDTLLFKYKLEVEHTDVITGK